MHNRNLLHSHLFLLAFLILTVNDWLFKALIPGVLTGKLSDFAGLVSFALFFSSLCPRLALRVHVITATLFLYFKLPASDPVIHQINLLLPFDLKIHRTVDFWDCIALMILPFSYRYFVSLEGQTRPSFLWRLVFYPVVLFVFAASGIAKPLAPAEREFIDNYYSAYSYYPYVGKGVLLVPGRRDELRQKIENRNYKVFWERDPSPLWIRDVFASFIKPLDDNSRQEWIITPRDSCCKQVSTLLARECNQFISAVLFAEQQDNNVKLTVRDIHLCDGLNRIGEDEALRMFQRLFVE